MSYMAADLGFNFHSKIQIFFICKKKWRAEDYFRLLCLFHSLYIMQPFFFGEDIFSFILGQRKENCHY